MTNWQTRLTPGNPSVGLIIASYLNNHIGPRRQNAMMCLLYSLLAQTYENWSALLVHDGPIEKPEHEAFFKNLENIDPRIKTVVTEERIPHYGHPHRRKYALELNCDYTGFSNEDNYYVPVYFEWMLGDMLQDGADFAHCDMLHSHYFWELFKTRPAINYIDIGAFLVRTDRIEQTPWPPEWAGFEADGQYVRVLALNCEKCISIGKPLFVHN